MSLLDRQISSKGAYKLKERKKGDKIPIVSDTMFQTMINNEERKKYASYLIALSLNKSYDQVYESIIFVNNKMENEKEIEKRRTVDFVCKIDNEIIGIEMNNNDSKTMLERNISYAADLYKSKMLKGKVYEYQKVVQININNFTFEGNENTVETYSLKNESKEELTDKIKFIHIYLPNIRKKDYNEINKLEQLLLVFNEDKETSKMIAKGDEIMEEYIEESIDASEDDEIIGLYDKELHLEKLRLSDIEEAKEEGLKQGIEQSNIKIINNMLDKGLDIDTISRYIGISKEEIEKLIN